MIKKVVFKIEDMDCTSCAMVIDGDLEDSGLIKSCNTSYAKSQTSVEFDPGKINEDGICKLIEKTGYKCAAVD